MITQIIYSVAGFTSYFNLQWQVCFYRQDFMFGQYLSSLDTWQTFRNDVILNTQLKSTTPVKRLTLPDVKILIKSCISCANWPHDTLTHHHHRSYSTWYQCEYQTKLHTRQQGIQSKPALPMKQNSLYDASCHRTSVVLVIAIRAVKLIQKLNQFLGYEDCHARRRSRAAPFVTSQSVTAKRVYNTIVFSSRITPNNQKKLQNQKSYSVVILLWLC